jgi:hypothetical protein
VEWHGRFGDSQRAKVNAIIHREVCSRTERSSRIRLASPLSLSGVGELLLNAELLVSLPAFTRCVGNVRRGTLRVPDTRDHFSLATFARGLRLPRCSTRISSNGVQESAQGQFA